MTPYDDPVLQIAGARDRALKYLPGRPQEAATSLTSDLTKIKALRDGNPGHFGAMAIELLAQTPAYERAHTIRVWIETTCATLITAVMTIEVRRRRHEEPK